MFVCLFVFANLQTDMVLLYSEVSDKSKYYFGGRVSESNPPPPKKESKEKLRGL